MDVAGCISAIRSLVVHIAISHVVRACKLSVCHQKHAAGESIYISMFA